MEKRKLKVNFNKSGRGSYTPRLSLPIIDLRDMGITPEDRQVTYYYDKKNKQIIIKKEN